MTFAASPGFVYFELFFRQNRIDLAMSKKSKSRLTRPLGRSLGRWGRAPSDLGALAEQKSVHLALVPPVVSFPLFSKRCLL